MNIPLGFGRRHAGRALLTMSNKRLKYELAQLEKRRAESIGCGFDLFHIDVWIRAINAVIKHKERKCERK